MLASKLALQKPHSVADRVKLHSVDQANCAKHMQFNEIPE